MIEMPLFPLNTVLFPGMPLQLHIFEERYKEMIQLCLDQGKPFGVVFIQNGLEAHGPLAEPHSVGTAARILEVQPLKEGQMNIVALGQERFRILSLNYEKPYLTGIVEQFPLDGTDSHSLDLVGKRLLPWVKRYMHILNHITDAKLDPQEIPEDPLVMGYVSAVLLQVPPEEKQRLLAFERAIDLLTRMLLIYRREVALLQAIVHGKYNDESSNFSLN
jgi:uncharacterized protein